MPGKLGQKRLKTSVNDVQLSLGCDTYGCDYWNSGILSILELVSTISLRYDGLPPGSKNRVGAFCIRRPLPSKFNCTTQISTLP